jgi:hydroxylysine kinase
MATGTDLLAQITRESALDGGAERFPDQLVTTERRRQYGLEGRLTRIPTEKDDTFRLATDAGRYLIKIAPATESARIVNLQSAVMLHLEQASGQIPVQRLIRGLRGQVESTVVDPAGDERILRVMNYLDGDLLHAATPTAAQLRSVGATLARLDGALADFRHPDESRRLIWDLKNFVHMRPLLEFVNDRDHLSMATWVFDQFDEHVAPRLDALETQMIHGDFSPFNVVVDPADEHFVTGIIDFGDVVRSPIVFELSVAVANQIGADERRPWRSALDIVAGYRALRAVPTPDIELLAITGPARLLLRALIFGWRATTHPHSRDYGLSHSAQDWTRLRCALSVTRASTAAQLAHIPGPSPSTRKEQP